MGARATENTAEIQGHVMKENALRKSVGEKRKLVEDLDGALANLITKRKSKFKI